MGETVEGLTVEQELLVRAVLLRGPDATEAWHAWRTSTSLDALDRDSQWLLPLLYCNLRAEGVPPNLLIRYRNVYLHNWYKNSLMLKGAEAAIRSLQRDGTVVLLGGGAMALRYYEALGARPFGPLSVLVRAHAGTLDSPPRCGDDGLDVRTSLFGGAIDEAVTERARPAAWKAMRWMVLHPVDQLVDICVRRQAWDHRSKLFWMVDAATLVRRHPDLDWTGVARLAAQTGHWTSVSGSLTWLETHFALGIPAAAHGPVEPEFGHARA